jgi:hypothetical protein
MKIREAFKVAAKTRTFWILGLISFIEVVAITVVSLLSLRVTTVNIPVHFSSYPNTFFNDRWYYVLAFILFAIVIFVVHLFLTAKLISSEKRELVPVVQFIGVLVLLIALMVVLNIFNIIGLRLQI